MCKSNFLLKPKVKVFVLTICTVLIAILTGLLVNQISGDGVILWSEILEKSTFYLLLFFVAIYIWVQMRFLASEEAGLFNFSDDKFCIAHARRTELEGYAQMIKNNPNKLKHKTSKDLLESLGVKK